MMKKGFSQRKRIKKKIRNGIRRIKIAKRRIARKRSSSRFLLPKLGSKAKLPKKKYTLGKQNDFAPQEVEVSKFAATAVLEKPIQAQSLPWRYNDNRIVILARDPFWLHAYWDISGDLINRVIRSIPGDQKDNLKRILRIYDITEIYDFNKIPADRYFDIEINQDACNRYINVNNPERTFYVEIGFKTIKGNFFTLARSNIIKTPYFGISDLIDEEWALADEDYYKILGVYDLGRSSLERRRKLEEIIKGQISSGIFSGGISSLPSVKKKEREFFLEVATELVIYGRTKPGATVSVGDNEAKLREDGTFSLRYALPEGDFKYDVIATSPDKKEKIKKIPAVKRYKIK